MRVNYTELFTFLCRISACFRAVTRRCRVADMIPVRGRVRQSDDQQGRGVGGGGRYHGKNGGNAVPVGRVLAIHRVIGFKNGL